MKKYDYIVVGGGAAGAVVASRLSEQPEVSVLLLEAGGSGTSPFVRIPNGVFFIKGKAQYHWLRKIEPDETRNGRREKLNSGRGLGGGSSINGMTFVKGFASDYEEWERLAGSEWSLNRVSQAFDKVDQSIHVQAPDPIHPIAQKFYESALAYGLPKNDSDLVVTGAGVMYCPTNVHKGIRQSTQYCYLRPARKRGNLTIETHATVTRVLIENKTAIGVAYVKSGQEHTAYANGEVILCSGAINSPHLLMLSGIGPADHLKSFGISPIVDQPNVGADLQDHPATWVSATVKERTWTDNLGALGMARSGLQWLLRRSGPAASGISQVTAYGYSQPDIELPDYQVNFVPAGYAVSDTGVSFIKTSSVSTAVALCRPEGRGSVRLRSGRFDDDPAIHYRLLSSQKDIKALTEACKATREIYAQKPFGDTVISEVSPGADVRSDAQWEAYLRQHTMNMCHPSGTCRMGSSEDAALDPRLRVRGIKGLRVADASVMPTITSGNTNAPTIMIGEQAARFIIEDRSAGSLSARSDREKREDFAMEAAGQ